MLGNFPNEFLVYGSIKNQRLTENSHWLWIYLVAMVILSGFSIQRQWGNRKRILSATDFKKYDFRFRAPSAHPGTGAARKPGSSRQGPGTSQMFAKSQIKYGLMAEDE